MSDAPELDGCEVFCSYSRRDTSLVDSLVHELERQKFPVWVDRSRMRAGHQWRTQIVTSIKAARILLIVISPNSVKSKNVRKELDIAEQNDIRVLPVIVKKTVIPDGMEYQLVGVEAVLLYKDFKGGLGKLVQAMKDLGVRPGRVKPPKPPRQSLWTRAPVQFGLAGVLAAIGVWGAGALGAVPDSIRGLQLSSSMEPGTVGLASAGVLGLLGLVLVLLRRWLGKSPPLWGPAVYLVVMLPAVLILGQGLAALVGAAVAVAVAIWRKRGAPLLRPGVAVAQALVLFAAPVLGAAAENVDLTQARGPARLFAVSIFDLVGEEQGPGELVNFSRDFRESIHQVYSEADIDVQPESFEAGTLADWHPDRFKKTVAALGLEPSLSMRNISSRCQEGSDFVWVSMLDPFPGHVQVIGKTSQVDLIALVVALELVKKIHDHGKIRDHGEQIELLTEEQQNRLKREIVRKIYIRQLAQTSAEEAEAWRLLLEQEPIDEQAVAEQMELILPSSCPEPELREAYAENLASLS